MIKGIFKALRNKYREWFIHKNDKSHVPLVRYQGMTCTGYVCSKCGYEWYEYKNEEK